MAHDPDGDDNEGEHRAGALNALWRPHTMLTEPFKAWDQGTPPSPEFAEGQGRQGYRHRKDWLRGSGWEIRGRDVHAAP